MFLVSSARAVGNLIFSPGTVQSMAFVGVSPVLRFSVQVANTSSLGITVNSFAANVFSNGQIVGTVYNFMPFQIAGNSQSLLIVDAQLQIVGIVNDLIKAFQTKNFKHDIQIQGMVNANYVQIPVNLKFTVGA